MRILQDMLHFCLILVDQKLPHHAGACEVADKLNTPELLNAKLQQVAKEALAFVIKNGVRSGWSLTLHCRNVLTLARPCVPAKMRFAVGENLLCYLCCRLHDCAQHSKGWAPCPSRCFSLMAKGKAS